MSSSAPSPSLSVVILAAGAGKRMKSNLPKPLHAVAGKPMLAHVLGTARTLEPVDVTIVGSPEIELHLGQSDWASNTSVAIQDPPLGTAHAVRQALDAGASGDLVLVLYADHPLVTPDVVTSLVSEFDPERQRLAVMTCNVDDAAGYGRIDRDERGRLRSIVEKVVDDEALRVGSTEINSGVMVLDRRWAADALARLQPNPDKNEYFLTDLVAMAYAEDVDSVGSSSGNADVLVGVNDRAELATAEALLYERKRLRLLDDGVTLIDPTSNLIGPDVVVGKDTILGPNCFIEGPTTIGIDCRIGPNVVLRSSAIADRVRIESSTIENSSVGSDSDVGPYAHLRGGTEISQHVHIGNFAELKNARIDDGVRIGHFSYVGDASLGADVNIGAGTVTCNFDGVDKHRTVIGAGAFIGSDSMLIAPLTIGPGARTGAGAVVTKNVAEGATVVGMPARSVRRKPVDSPGSDAEGAG